MAKKPKTLETKLRSAIRLIWSRSSERRAIIKQATLKDPQTGECFIICPLCNSRWPVWAGEVDHAPAIGAFTNWRDVESFIDKMFYGPQRVICKTCHKRRTAEQRRKNA